MNLYNQYQGCNHNSCGCHVGERNQCGAMNMCKDKYPPLSNIPLNRWQSNNNGCVGLGGTSLGTTTSAPVEMSYNSSMHMMDAPNYMKGGCVSYCQGSTEDYDHCLNGENNNVIRDSYINNHYKRYNHYNVTDRYNVTDYVHDYNVYHHNQEVVYCGTKYSGANNVCGSANGMHYSEEQKICAPHYNVSAAQPYKNDKTCGEKKWCPGY